MIAAVGYDPVSIAKAFLICNHSSRTHQMRQQLVALAPYIRPSGDVLFRHKKNMHRRLRRNIPEGIDQIILINLGARNGSFYNFAKQTVIHF